MANEAQFTINGEEVHYSSCHQTDNLVPTGQYYFLNNELRRSTIVPSSVTRDDILNVLSNEIKLELSGNTLTQSLNALSSGSYGELINSEYNRDAFLNVYINTRTLKVNRSQIYHNPNNIQNEFCYDIHRVDLLDLESNDIFIPLSAQMYRRLDDRINHNLVEIAQLETRIENQILMRDLSPNPAAVESIDQSIFQIRLEITNIEAENNSLNQSKDLLSDQWEQYQAANIRMIEYRTNEEIINDYDDGVEGFSLGINSLLHAIDGLNSIPQLRERNEELMSEINELLFDN